MLSTCVLIFCFAFCAGQLTEDEVILELTQSNFELAKNQFKNLLVEFYVPWCGHCRSIAPEYENAAKMMNDEGFPVKFAKVNGDEQIELRDAYNITGYPSFKFFLATKDRVLDYTAGRHAGDFVNFIRKKVASPVHPVTNVEDAVSIVNHNKLIFFGFFPNPDSEAAKTFRDFAFDHDKYLFIATQEPEVLSHFQVKADAIVAFKQFDEGKAVLEGPVTYDSIKKFCTTQKLPLVSVFNEESAEEIFTTDVKKYLALFAQRQVESFTHISDNFLQAAKHFYGRVVFIFIDIDEEENEKVLEFFGLPATKCPALRLIDMTSDDPLKYNPSSPDLDVPTIQAFVSSVLQGEAQPFYKSEEVPSNWDQTVKVLVGSTFDSFIKNAQTNVLVNFYVPWCGHCKKIAPIWQELGDKYKGSEKIVVSKIDASLNEVSSLKVEQYPAIKLFVKETKEVIDFTGLRTLEALVEFVESDGKVIKVPEEITPTPTQAPKIEL